MEAHPPFCQSRMSVEAYRGSAFSCDARAEMVLDLDTTLSLHALMASLAYRCGGGGGSGSGAPVAPPDVGCGTTGDLTSSGTRAGGFSTFGLAGLEPPLVPRFLGFPSRLTFVSNFTRGSDGTPLCRPLHLDPVDH